MFLFNGFAQILPPPSLKAKICLAWQKFFADAPLADFKYAIIYPLASRNMALQNHLKMVKKGILDQIWRTVYLGG